MSSLAIVPPLFGPLSPRSKDSRRLKVFDVCDEAVYNRMTSLCARAFDVPFSLFCLLDGERQWFASQHGLRLAQMPRGLSFCSHVIEENETLVVPDALHDVRFHQNPLVTGALKLRFFAGAPLVSREGEVLGALCVLDCAPRLWGESQSRMLEELASVATDEIELGRRGQRLGDAKTRFQSAFDRAATGMALLCLRGKWMEVNVPLCALLGYSEDEFRQRTLADVSLSDEESATREAVEQLKSGGIGAFESERQLVRRDGTPVWVALNIALVRDERGEPLCLVAQIQDVSLRKHMEHKLLQSEVRHASIIHTAPDGIVSLGADMKISEWNLAMERIFGIPRDGALNQCFDQLVGLSKMRAPDTHLERLKAAMESGGGDVWGEHLELFALRADGEKIPVELAVVPVPSDGAPLFTAHVRDVSKRRKSEERLRMLESVVVNANDAILVTEAEPINEPGPRILYANESYQRMSGYTQEEIIGKTPRILHGHGTNDEARAKIRRALKRWKPVVVDLVNYKKDGTPFWVELSITPVADETGWFTHWVSIQRDITERRQTTERLRESEARYQRIAAKVPGMVYQFVMEPDTSFHFPFVSEGCREVFCLEPEQVMGDASLIVNLVHPEDAIGFLESVMASAETSEAWEWQGRIVLPSGEMKWIRGSSRPTREPEGQIVWDGILFDVSETIKGVEQLQNAKIEAETARVEAERANAAKSEFLSRMSHELRTPLNAILGFGQLLEMAPLGDEDSQSAGQIVKAGRHLLELINEVLDIARIESGQVSLSPEPLDAGEVALEALDLVRPLAAARGLELCIEGAAPGEVGLVADRQRLKQILLNLLSNAVKYNRAGGSICLFLEEHDESVRVGVSDTGLGIAPDDIERLWTPFDRLGAENTDIEGTGVGLAVSQHLAKAMGAKLQVESVVGQGSRFWLDLPRATLYDGVLGVIPLPDSVPIESTKLVLLYIEDNPSNLQLVQRLLAHRPEIRLLSAMNGTLGCELAHSHCPDLILLDMHLPDLRGDDVLARLKGHHATSSIPVVVLSADVTPGRIRRTLEAGAHSFLPKPLEVAHFLACLDEIVALKNGDSVAATSLYPSEADALLALAESEVFEK